jgi:hypothetical protein
MPIRAIKGKEIDLPGSTLYFDVTGRRSTPEQLARGVTVGVVVSEDGQITHEIGTVMEEGLECVARIDKPEGSVFIHKSERPVPLHALVNAMNNIMGRDAPYEESDIDLQEELRIRNSLSDEEVLARSLGESLPLSLRPSLRGALRQQKNRLAGINSGDDDGFPTRRF